MTPNKVIEYIDGIRPNAYDEEVKLRWINNVDCMVKKLVFGHKKIVPYTYPDDMDKELIIEAPFDDVYSFYLESMIDYYNREYANYNNSAMMFESRFSEYKKAVIRGEIEPTIDAGDIEQEEIPPVIPPPQQEEPPIIEEEELPGFDFTT